MSGDFLSAQCRHCWRMLVPSRRINDARRKRGGAIVPLNKRRIWFSKKERGAGSWSGNQQANEGCRYLII